MFLYCLLRSFLAINYRRAGTGVLLFAYGTETMQYLPVVELLHLQDNHFACIIIGTQFSWMGMLMYTIGIGLVWRLEYQGRRIHARNDGLVCRKVIEGDFDREVIADNLPTTTYFSSFDASFAFSKVSFIHTG
jgi:hypothetical protein